MVVKIDQEIELSLTEALIPEIVHVKQFDHMSRKISCVLYKDSKVFSVPESVIISCTGTRPDGKLFQYSSEASPELVFLEDGKIIFTITDFMTEAHGRYPIDLLILSDDGAVIGMFTLVLKVERAAVNNHKMAIHSTPGTAPLSTAGIPIPSVPGSGSGR